MAKTSAGSDGKKKREMAALLLSVIIVCFSFSSSCFSSYCFVSQFAFRNTLDVLNTDFTQSTQSACWFSNVEVFKFPFGDVVVSCCSSLPSSIVNGISERLQDFLFKGQQSCNTFGPTFTCWCGNLLAIVYFFVKSPIPCRPTKRHFEALREFSFYLKSLRKLQFDCFRCNSSGNKVG